MTIKRMGFVFLGSLLLLLGTSSSIDAQRVPVCGWCDWWDGFKRASMMEYGTEDSWGRHSFPTSAADACGGDEWGTCAACGGSSMCHRFWMRGPCHVPCDGVFAGRTTLEEVQEALAENDIDVLASALSRERAGVFVEFIPESGRIDVLLSCDPNRAAHTIPVEPELREKLKAALAARPA